MQHSISIGGSVTDSFIDLGVILRADMSMNDQISAVVLLRSIRANLTRNSLCNATIALEIYRIGRCID